MKQVQSGRWLGKIGLAVALAIGLAGVGVGCWAEEVKPVNQSAEKTKPKFLTMVEDHAPVCKVYADYFNSHYSDHVPYPTQYFDERNFNEAYGTLTPDRKMPPNAKEDYSGEYELEPDFKSFIGELTQHFKGAKGFSGSVDKIYETNIDLEGKGQVVHLFHYSNDRQDFRNRMMDQSGYSNVYFVVGENPWSFDVDKNNKLFYPIYDYHYSCESNLLEEDVMHHIRNSLIPAEGIDQWLFKYQNKFYYDFVDHVSRVKIDCDSDGYHGEYDLSSKVFIHEISNPKPICVFNIMNKQGDNQ